MRDILFRGYDVIGKKWVYGDLVHNQKVTKTGLEPRVMVGGYEVSPESVGQYIGKTDKKGNKIYEGDRIYIEFSDGSNIHVIVGWNPEFLCYGVINTYDYKYSVDEGYPLNFKNYFLENYYHYSIIFEVVGNLFQDKGLLL